MLPQAWHLGFTTAASLEQQFLTSPNIAKQSAMELQLTGILFTFTRRFWVSINFAFEGGWVCDAISQYSDACSGYSRDIKKTGERKQIAAGKDDGS